MSQVYFIWNTCPLMTDTKHAWFGCPQYCGNDYRGLGEGALTLALLLIMLFTKVALRKLRTDAGKGLDAKRFPHMAKGNGGSCVNPQYNNWSWWVPWHKMNCYNIMPSKTVVFEQHYRKDVCSFSKLHCCFCLKG